MSTNAKNENKERYDPEVARRLWVNLRDEVKRAWPINRALEQLVGAKLITRGNTAEACCPFHVERTPSFTVNIARGTYRCFGVGCGAQGDVFALIRDTQNLDFQAAMIFGADQAGVNVPDMLRKYVEGRTGVAPSAARTVVRYPDAGPRVAPAVLADPKFIKPAEDTRRATAGREFTLWNNGGKNGDKDFEKRSYRPQMVHDYRNTDGELLMSILRVTGRDKKFFIPARLMPPSGDCPSYLLEKQEHEGKQVAWVSLGLDFGEAKPIYGMEDVRAWAAKGGHNLLIVEGEKTRDAAKRLLASADPDGRWLVLTPMGGSKSAIYADWAPLVEHIRGRNVNVVTWPDADKPLTRPDGSVEDRLENAVTQILSSFAQRAIDMGVTEKVIYGRINPPQGVESGWDLADAEAEGWSGQQTIDYIKANSFRVSRDSLMLRAAPTDTDKISAVEAPEGNAPFDLAGKPADPAAEDDVEDWIEMLATMENEGPMNFDAIDAPLTDADLLPVPERVAAQDIIQPGDIANGGEDDPLLNNPLHNQYFRCLGYLNNINYFMSLTSGQVFDMGAPAMKSNALLHLAPRDWWLETFPGGRGNQANGGAKVDWEMAVDALISGSYAAGVWDPRMQCSQGARLDGGSVVFNTGSKLYVEGQGIVPIQQFSGKYTYCIGPKTVTPATNAPFLGDSPEPRQYLDLIGKLDWRDQSRELSIMALFGWAAISPICGILKWRSHIWLDGPRGAGKSWVTNNLLKPVLGDFVVNVLANSSESGIRNMLNCRSVPVLFDEAEGEDRESRMRMDAIIKLARHSAVESESVVAQGVSGGGATRYHSIASMFLMTSIVPQLEQAADQSRFARIKLASGRKHDSFSKDIETPAAKLLTQDFSNRWIGRMILRASDYHETHMHMVHGLSKLGLERRVADVYGTFATGCWLMLRDGVPADEVEAALFISDEFKVFDQLTDFNSELADDKDHNRLFNVIMAHEVKMDGQNNGGSRFEQMGVLMEIACGMAGPETAAMVSEEEARIIISRYGIRPGIGDRPVVGDERPDCLLIHKKSTPICGILEKTPYARSYADVMHQADDVKMGKPVRFGSGFGSCRSIIVPLKHFSIGD